MKPSTLIPEMFVEDLIFAQSGLDISKNLLDPHTTKYRYKEIL